MKTEQKEGNLSREKVFQKILYSEVFEDPLLNKKALNIKPGNRVLCIASAGDNAFAHLLDDPAEVVAVDLNPAQLMLCRLKSLAIEHLDYEETLEFLGVLPSKNRRNVFEKIQHFLGEDDMEYWQHNIELIENGVIHSGRFQKYLNTFRTKVLPWIHSKKTVVQLFEIKDLAEQEKFYHRVWNNWRYRLLCSIFFSKPVMAKLGRSKRQFEQVQQKNNIAEQFLSRAQFVLTKLPAYKNPFLRYLLLGNYTHECLPLYLEKENFKNMKSRLNRIRWKHAALGDFLDKNTVKFDAFNLSDIFEYLSPEVTAALAEKIYNSANNNARLSYWNFLVRRVLSDYEPQHFSHITDTSKMLWMQDRAFVYGDYILEEVKSKQCLFNFNVVERNL